LFILIIILMHHDSFFVNATAAPEIYTLSLHDALPIWVRRASGRRRAGDRPGARERHQGLRAPDRRAVPGRQDGDRWRVERIHGIDRKSTRLNASHVIISYAVFCLKKKKMHGTIRPG